MNTLEAIAARVSYRGRFSDEKVPRADLIKATPHKDHLLDFVRILLASFPSYRPKTP